jgi:hypothetical protein
MAGAFSVVNSLGNIVSSSKAALDSVSNISQVGIDSAQAERLYVIRSASGLASQQDKSNRGTYAKIKLLNPNSDTSDLNGGGSNVSWSRSARSKMVAGNFADFLVTDFQFSVQEKTQVIPVFGDSEDVTLCRLVFLVSYSIVLTVVGLYSSFRHINRL